jgi:hypothetical protein
MLQSTFWFLWMPQLNMTVNAGPVRSLTSLSSQSGMFHLFISRLLAFEGFAYSLKLKDYLIEMKVRPNVLTGMSDWTTCRSVECERQLRLFQHRPFFDELSTFLKIKLRKTVSPCLMKLCV